MKLTENDVLRLLLARRENYSVSHITHQQGRVYNVTMKNEHYNAVVLVSSFDFYEKRYHIAENVPTLVICYEHNTVLPVPVLSLRAGNFAKSYELPDEIKIGEIETQRYSKTGSKVLLGMYISGMRWAQTYINEDLPATTRKRYLARAKALAKRPRGKPVGKIAKVS